MKYNFVTQPKTVTVITPTIGSAKLLDAVESIKSQTYEYVNHLVVIDGPDYASDVYSILPIDHNRRGNKNINDVVCPYNTGGVGDGFYGHRIYAAYPHLVNTDYIFFLDEDNWYAPDHVESLVKVLEQNDFAYSLRQIYDENKNYLCDDNCESLGKWPIYFTHGKDESFLIDTSSFAFRREFLIKVSQFWHHGWGGDRNFFYNVKDHCKWDTNGKHTLCYRLDGNPNSVTADFFEKGNKSMAVIYGDKFPWIKA
jgi:glycosyltransferase involved in cell wall biosynthesis